MTIRQSLHFEDFVLDESRLCLEGPNGRVQLRPKSFEVLRYLLEQAGRVVSTSDLVDAVWPNVTVSDASLTQCVSEVRQALGPGGRHIIKTVPRRGYLVEVLVTTGPAIQGNGQREVVEPEEETVALRRDGLQHGKAVSDVSGAARDETIRSDSRPSIAVLPFDNMSGDPEQEYFSDGITEDLITDLSKISGLFVVARYTTFTYKGKLVSVQQVSRDLGTAFILEGSVRKAGSRVRVSAQLVDGRDGGHLWADRYDRDLTDIFAIQDDITHAIVDQLKVRLLPEEKTGIGRVPTGNVEAYGYYLRGRQFLHRHSKAHYVLAKRMFAKAVALDPMYARAHAGIADCDSFLFLHYNEDVSVDGILAASARALDLENGLAEAHASRGLALSLQQRHAQAMAEFEQAIALDTNLFEAHYFSARACFAQGRLPEAARHFQRAADVDPDDYQALLLLTQVLRSLGREDEMTIAARAGVARAERELALHPENSRPAYLGAISLVRLGEFDRAKEWAGRALVIDPDDSLAKYNVACFYSLLGDHERAIELLLELLPSATYERKQWIRHDSDLDALRSHPRFAEVIEQLG